MTILAKNIRWIPNRSSSSFFIMKLKLENHVIYTNFPIIQLWSIMKELASWNRKVVDRLSY